MIVPLDRRWSIEDIPWSGKLTEGAVKGNGVFIHEDGTGGYYMEFDWGEEEEKTKSKSAKVGYSDDPGMDNLNALVYDGLNDVEFQTDALLSLAGVNFHQKRGIYQYNL